MTEEKKEKKDEEEKTEAKSEEKEEGKPTEKKKEKSVEKGEKEEKKEKEEAKEEKTIEKEAKKEEKKEEEFEIPKKFKKLVEEIEQLSVLDLSELVKVLEKKFGVTAAAPAPQVAVSGSAPSAGGEAAAPAEQKSVFNIELKAIGDKKIEVIKAVRDITGKGLKEAKDLVDAAASSPQIIKENVKKEEAEEIQKKLQEAGATVELK